MAKVKVTTLFNLVDTQTNAPAVVTDVVGLQYY